MSRKDPRHREPKMWICEKCGKIYDHSITYEPERYCIPRYGKQVKGLCHNCRLHGRRPYVPRPGKTWDVLKYMRDEKQTVCSKMYDRFGFHSQPELGSVLSTLKARNVLYIKAKKKKQSHYYITKEYMDKLKDAEV